MLTTVDIINVILTCYVIPAMISYICTRWMHTYVYTYSKPNIGDIFFVLCPFVNMITAFASVIEVTNHKSKGRGKKKKKGPSIGEIFFRIKRED